MDIFSTTWDLVVLHPIANLFSIFYETFFSDKSLIAAIFAFSLTLRVLLFPLSLFSSIGKEERKQIEKSMKTLESSYVNDIDRKKRLQRAILSDHFLSLFLSGLSFVITILFLFGLRFLLRDGISTIDSWLYTLVEKPIFSHDSLFGIDPFHINIAFAALTSGVLFTSLSLSQLDLPFFVSNGDKVFRYIFPFIAFLLIRNEPAGVSLFIISSATLSTIVLLIKRLIQTTARVLKPPSLEVLPIRGNNGDEGDE